MATAQDLLDDLNQRLGDANNAAGVGQVTKLRWVAHGIRAMYPRCFRNVVDSTSITLVSGTYEYTLPATFDDAEIYRIEVQVGPSLERYVRVDQYLIDRRAGKILTFGSLPGVAGAKIRIHAVAPCVTAGLAVGTTLDFPDQFMEVPVWYALALAMQNGQEGRLDYTRYSTVQTRNGVDVGEIMSSAQFCFAQFELLLDRLAMPFPVS